MCSVYIYGASCSSNTIAGLCKLMRFSNQSRGEFNVSSNDKNEAGLSSMSYEVTLDIPTNGS